MSLSAGYAIKISVLYKQNGRGDPRESLGKKPRELVQSTNANTEGGPAGRVARPAKKKMGRHNHQKQLKQQNDL